MIENKGVVLAIKRTVSNLQGREIEVNYTPGRNKRVRYTGVLVGVYPEIFTVQPKEKERIFKTTFQYTEILCGEVKLKKLS